MKAKYEKPMVDVIDFRVEEIANSELYGVGGELGSGLIPDGEEWT